MAHGKSSGVMGRVAHGGAARAATRALAIGAAAGVLLLAPGGRAAAQPADASRAMDAVYARFSEGYVKLDADAVAGLYTEDALYLGPGGDVRRGRRAIAEAFRGFFDGVRAAGDSVRISFVTIDRGADGDLGYDIGYYALVRRGGDGAPRRGRGKFATVWKRGGDGAWRIHVDSYSDAPPE